VSRVRNIFWIVVVVVIIGSSLAPGAIGSLVSGFHLPGSRYYDLPSAEVDAVVKRDGSVRVVETITFSFHGTYTGAFRDIPLAPGQSISDVGVAERGIPYSPGASTVLGSFGQAGTFGDAQLPDRERIVWHYSATDEPRAFTLSYTLHGVLIVHPDVVDMNMNVWGDGWPAGSWRPTTSRRAVWSSSCPASGSVSSSSGARVGLSRRPARSSGSGWRSPAPTGTCGGGCSPRRWSSRGRGRPTDRPRGLRSPGWLGGPHERHVAAAR